MLPHKFAAIVTNHTRPSATAVWRTNTKAALRNEDGLTVT
jgi:hypothetical protein